MNYNINSSGLYDINAYNLIATHATVLSSLNVNGNILGSNNTLFNNPITCVSSLNVSGTSNLNNLNVSGTTILNNITTINSSLNVSGLTTLNNVNIQGNLNVSGTTTIIDTVINNTTFNSLSVSGPSIFYSNVTLVSPLNVLGNTRLNNVTTCLSSLNVSGISTFNSYTIMNGNSQTEPKILLSGQEYLTSYQPSTDGIALLLGANRPNARILFVADSTKLAQNTTNPIMAINPAGRIDFTSTDSTVRLPASFNGSIFTGSSYEVSLRTTLYVQGTTTLNNVTTINSSLNVSGTTILNNHTTINAPLYINTNQYTSLSALTKEEYLFGIISKPEVQNGVFIDRGVISVMDMHLRMSEIKNLGELTRYGNGFYTIRRT